MKIINTFNDTIRLQKCKEYLAQLYSQKELDALYGEYVLAAQLESVRDNCLLQLIIDRICEVLETQVPKVRVEEQMIRVERLLIFEIIDSIDSNFFAYLHKTSIAKLKVSINTHLSNTLRAVKESCPEFSRLDFSEYIGIELRGYTKENKHIGKIDLLLQQKGYKIFYFNETEFAYENSRARVKDTWVMVANAVYFAHLTNVKVLYLTSSPAPIQEISKLRTKILHIGHNFNEALGYTAWRRKEEHIYNSLFVGRIDRVDYLLASTKNEYLFCKKAFEKYGLDPSRIIKAGNPSLDYALEKYQEVKENQEDTQNLLIAPSYFSNLSENQAMREMLTNLICGGGGGILLTLFCAYTHSIMRERKILH